MPSQYYMTETCDNNDTYSPLRDNNDNNKDTDLNGINLYLFLYLIEK